MTCRSSVIAVVDHIFYFFFNDTATTEIYTLSLHDALPIYIELPEQVVQVGTEIFVKVIDIDLERRRISLSLKQANETGEADRKSTRLNSSHANISYAVFCLKKKKN